jgi:hypothetical protein
MTRKRKARRYRLVFIKHKLFGDLLMAIQERVKKNYYKHIDKVSDANGVMWEVEVREVLPRGKKRNV